MFKAWRLEPQFQVPLAMLIYMSTSQSPVRRVFFIDMGSRGHTWSTQGPSCSLHFLESQVCINPAVPEAGGDSSFNPGDACPKVGSAETQDVDFRTLGTILSQPLTNPCLSCRRSSPRFPNRSQRLVPCIQNSVYLFLNSFFFSSLFRSSCFCKVAGRTSTHMILSEDKMDVVLNVLRTPRRVFMF